MRLATIAVLAACGCGGGRGKDAAPPVALPRVMLVGCAPATPAPILEDDGTTFGGLPREPEVEPALDPEVLRTTLRAHMKDFGSCYTRELAANPQARMTALAFTIEADGSVTSVSAGSPGLDQCVQRAFASVRFPALPPGTSMRVRYPLTEQAGPAVPPSDPSVAVEPPPSDSPWTPFARATTPPPEAAAFLARTAEPVVRARLDAISACFHARAPTGSLRVMLELDETGHVRGVRAGGLGDAPAETCVARALDGIAIADPAHTDGVELACDLARGDAERWRVAPDTYDVIQGTRDVVTHAGQRFDPAGRVPDALPGDRTYLIVLEPGAPGRVLETALALAEAGDAALVAIQQPRGPALLVGAGRSNAALGAAHEEPGALDLAFDLAPDHLAACINGHADSAALDAPKRVDALLAQIAARCRTQACTRSAGLAVGPDVPATALAGTVAALRRAGFERVVIGGGIGCR